MDNSKIQYLYLGLSVLVGIILGLIKINYILGIVFLSSIQLTISLYEYKVRNISDKKVLLNTVLENVGTTIIFWSILATLTSQ